MRYGSFFVRTGLVCLFFTIFSAISVAQTDKITEGALRVLDAEGKSKGLCPLKNTEVKAEISGFLSRVTVTQNFRNPFNEKIEAVYTFPLPNDAAVDDMTIRIGERAIKAKIMERQKAQETYEKAKTEGKTAALLEQQRPNLFTQAVANIPPGAEIKVVISYIETLKYTDGIYEFAFPMTVGERYIPSAGNNEDAAKISPKSEFRPAHTISLKVELDAGVSVENLVSNTHEIEAQQFSARQYLVNLKNTEEIPNRDFVLRYKTAGERIEDAVLTHRGPKGGYFTLILQPPDITFPADTTPKEIVFVLDTSGSMDGFPIEKAKEAMRLSLDGLNPQDTFNLITFAGDTSILFEHPVPATSENLRKAKDFLASRKGNGGTEMMTAIRAALKPSDAQNHLRVVCFMTDGLVGNEFEIISEIQKHPNARVFSFGIGNSVNRFLLDEMARQGRGEVQYVNLTDDGSAAARKFYERVRNPLLTDISLEFQDIETAENFPARIPDLFDAKPVFIVGRYTKGGTGRVILHGKMQGQVFSREIPVEFPEQSTENDVLATLWARQKISELMGRDLEGLQADKFNDDLKQAVTDLGIEFRLMTQFTSFVAVDEQTVFENGVPKRIEVPVASPVEQENSIENLWVRRGGGGGGLMLSVGQNATVSVTSSSAYVTENVTREVVANMQRGNSIQSALSTATGVTQVNESQTLEKQGLISSNGQRPTSNNHTVDGADTNLGVADDETSISRNAGSLPTLTASGGTGSSLPISATAEVAVKTMSSAKEQRVTGGQINFVSRSGTNTFHGSVFESFGNESLNANDFFANKKGVRRAPARVNQFGGTLGGFIVRDKAFFFGNYEGLRLRQPAFAVSEVPDPTSRRNASGAIRPLFNAFPVANGPGTGHGFAEFSSVFTNPAENDIFGLRIDTRVTDQLDIRGRYNFAGSNAVIRGNKDFSLNTLHKTEVETNTLSIWSTFAASPIVVVSGNVNFSQNDIGREYLVDDFGGADISSTVLTSPFHFLKYDLDGKNSAIAAGDPINTRLNQFQAKGVVDWIAGNHAFAFGGEFRRLGLDISPSPTERSILFPGIDLQGTASLISEMTRTANHRPTLHNFSLFAHNSWRVLPQFNLNFGLRWDADFAPEIQTAGAIFQKATPNIPDRYKNLAPRLSFAYDPFDSGKTVIRAGIGLYFDHGNSAASEVFSNSFPFAGGTSARNTFFSDTPTAALTPLLAFSPDLKTPRTWHFYGEVQQEIVRNHVLTFTYNASLGRRLFLTRTIFEADPNFNFVRLTDNSARSDFHAAQIRFERRFSDGFSLNARYAFAKSIDNFSPDPIRENNFLNPDLQKERGVSDFDIRHNLSVYSIYDIPVFFDNGWKKFLTKGWSLSAFANSRTAFPVNVNFARTSNYGKELFRPDLIQGISLYLNENGIKRLNPNAFAISGEFGQGTLGRNTLRGFPLFQLDAGLQRRIKFTNEIGLNISINAFNLLNKTNFADMNGNLGTLAEGGNFLSNSYFGQTTSTFGSGNFTPFYLYGGPRTLQISAKFIF